MIILTYLGESAITIRRFENYGDYGDYGARQPQAAKQCKLYLTKRTGRREGNDKNTPCCYYMPVVLRICDLRSVRKYKLGVAAVMDRRFFAVRDVLILLFVVLPLCAYYLYASRVSRGGGGYAEISVDGSVDAVISLDGDAVYSPEGMPAVRIAVRGGAVGFVSSDCPDKICVRSGFLRIPGQSAVCLPNRVVLRVASGGGDALDSTAY
jgi:hypothetical protein